MLAPLRRCAVVTAVAMLAGCDQPAPSVADLGGRVSVVTTDSITVLAHESYSGYRSSVRLVVSDPSAWAGAWQQVYALAQPQPPVPDVDFSTETVLVAGAGERSSGGVDIRIDSVVTLESGTEAYVTTLSAGPSCVTTAALTQPVQVVRVATLQTPVRFNERMAVEDCD